jgi:hypothetical protein
MTDSAALSSHGISSIRVLIDDSERSDYQSHIDRSAHRPRSKLIRESAPQQQVANGWVARDLLQIQSLALADILDALSDENAAGQQVVADDPRVSALPMIGVLAICWMGTTGVPPRRIDETSLQTGELDSRVAISDDPAT